MGFTSNVKNRNHFSRPTITSTDKGIPMTPGGSSRGCLVVIGSGGVLPTSFCHTSY